MFSFSRIESMRNQIIIMNTRSSSSATASDTTLEDLKTLIQQLQQVQQVALHPAIPIDSHDSAYHLILAETTSTPEVKWKCEIFLNRLQLKESVATAYSNTAAGRAVSAKELSSQQMAPLLQSQRQPRKSTCSCSKCNHTNHSTSQCYAKTKKDGSLLE
jgi:hypothetical protein